MYIDRHKLFVAMLVATVVLTAGFGVGLAFDIAAYRNANRPVAVQESGSAGGAGSDAAPGREGAPAGTAPGLALSGGAGALPGSSNRGGGVRVSGTAAVAPQNNVAISSGETILIGAVITQSGPGNVSDGYKAEQAYVQWVNRTGGINGHRLALDVKDDGGNPAVGDPAFQEIVQQDHAFAIVGECAPITDSTLTSQIAQDQVPVDNMCLTTPDAYKSPYIWFTGIPSNIVHRLTARFLYRNQNLSHIGQPWVLCLDQATTTPFCDGFVSEWTGIGGTTFCDHGRNCYQKIELGTTRAAFEEVALQIKSSGADSIVSFLEPSNQTSFLQALQDQQMSPAKPHSQGGWPQFAPLSMDPTTVETVGPFADGVLVESGFLYPDESQYPGIQQMDSIMNTYSPGTPIDIYVQQEWNSLVIFAEALRRMGSSVTRANLINTLNSMGSFSDGQQLGLGWTATNHGGPMFTRYATVQGPTQHHVISGWIDQNGNQVSGG